MRASIVCAHSTLEYRAKLVQQWFISNGFEAGLVVSDWDHIEKTKRTQFDEGSIVVPTRPYRRNISVARVLSNLQFSRSAMIEVGRQKPDIAYVMLPPNSLAKMAADYKRRFPNVRLIFDVLDLWPEAFPSNLLRRTPIFPIWRNLRNSSLAAADQIFAECDLFADVVRPHSRDTELRPLYYSRADEIPYRETRPREDSLRLCYLGSINNIIDIDAIARMVKILPGDISVDVIGDGESRTRLLNALQSNGANVKYHGKVFDPTIKSEILANCHFGINMMKPSVRVGLSMKSIEYMQHGLPILNNLKGDTEKLIASAKIGINVFDLNEPLDEDYVWTIARQRAEARRIFEERYSDRVFLATLGSAIGRF